MGGVEVPVQPRCTCCDVSVFPNPCLAPTTTVSILSHCALRHTLLRGGFWRSLLGEEKHRGHKCSLGAGVARGQVTQTVHMDVTKLGVKLEDHEGFLF